MNKTTRIFLKKIMKEIGFLGIVAVVTLVIMGVLMGVWKLLIYLFPERLVGIVIAISVLAIIVIAGLMSLIGWLKNKWQDAEWESRHGG